MSTVKANNIEPASGGTVTITGAALTTPALGTPASGNLANCTGLPASAVVNTPAGGISATTVQAALEELDSEKFAKSGGQITGNVGIGSAPSANSIAKVLELESGFNVFGYAGLGYVNANAYFNGGWLYKNNGAAGRYEVGDVHKWLNAPSGTAGDAITFVQNMALDNISLRPGTDNSQDLGSSLLRWAVVYAGTGAINTSDAREKTELRPLTATELAAGLELAKLGVGVFQFLDAVAKKGADRARLHVGYTVQQVMAVMMKHGLDPMRYAFICHDRWDAELVHHPAIEARNAVPAVPEVWEEREVDITIRVNGQDRQARRAVLQLVQPAQDARPAVEAQEAWTETVREAGDRYGFRPDQLDRFINAAVIQAAIEQLGL